MRDFLQAIIPLTFLAIWALASLFSRENRPVPNRPGQGMGPRRGPLPPGAGGPRPIERAGAGGGAGAGREPTLRWGPTGQEAYPQRRSPLSPDDDILIIRQEPTARPVSSRPPAPTPTPRRGGRSRPAPQPAPRRPETPLAKPLATVQGLKLAPKLAQSLDASGAVTSAEPLTAAAPVASARATPAAVIASRRLLDSPEKLRDALIVNEILQPPLALRRRGRG